MVIESDVISVLQEATKPLKAREIAALLQRTLYTDVTRSDVNQILYRLKTRGLAEIDEEFRWLFFPDTGRAESKRAETGPAGARDVQTEARATMMFSKSRKMPILTS